MLPYSHAGAQAFRHGYHLSGYQRGSGVLNVGKYTFIADDEFEALFGVQVVEGTRMLERHAEKSCRACGGECCQRVECGFYSSRFGSCPIYGYRPAKCRLYYCEKILENGLLSQEERKLIDGPVGNLLEVLKYAWGTGTPLEPPATAGEKNWLVSLGIEEEVNKTVQAFENDEIEHSLAKARLIGLVQQCRSRA